MGQIADSVPPPGGPPASAARQKVAGHPTAPRWAVTHAGWAPVLGHVVGLGGTFVGEDRAEAGPCAGIALTKHFTSWLNERRDPTDQLSLVFAALADPTRRAILAELTLGDATVTQLTAPLPISMPAVSRHLKVLEGAALISRSREGKWQRSHLEAVPLREAAVWIERFRGFWDSSFDRLDAHLATLQQEQENR